MKPIVAFSAILLAAYCSAAELNSNLLRLIPADARMISGVDIDRQGNSALDRFFMSGFNSNTSRAEKVVWIGDRTADATNGFSTLIAVIGATPSRKPEPGNSGDPLEEFTKLDADISVIGDPDTIREAQRRWTIDQPPSPIAVKVRRLSQSYDNWFLLVKPFSVFARTPADVVDTVAPSLKHRQDLVDAGEEISGGIRFGTINDFHLEVAFRNSEDSWAAATLARWLPGILQLEHPSHHSTAILVDAIEDLKIYASGRRVTISWRIPEDKARRLLDTRQSWPVVH